MTLSLIERYALPCVPLSSGVDAGRATSISSSPALRCNRCAKPIWLSRRPCERRPSNLLAPAKKTLGDLLREIGPWEGESGAELNALFTRQRGNRQVPDLP